MTLEELLQGHRIAWHLQGNHYPPITTKMVPYCQKAIRLARRGKWDRAIKFPSGDTMTVQEIVDECHLEGFLN